VARRTSKGITRSPFGWRAYVKVGSAQRERRFPRDTTLKTMQAWRDETRVSLRHAPVEPSTAGTLQHDIQRYLAQVKAMPTYAQRKEHLELWEAALGSRTPRARITVEQIRTVLHGWRAAGLAAATCNKRRTALMHLWSVLDGKDARNPVRAVRKFPPAPALPRGRDPHVIDAKLLAAPRCRSRASCRVILWAGLRPEELNRVDLDDVDYAQKTLAVRTAKGGRPRVVPLTSQALSAMREFDAADAWQDVPQAAPLNRWLKTHTGMATLRVYDLRHSLWHGPRTPRHQTRCDWRLDGTLHARTDEAVYARSDDTGCPDGHP
jgi:site-specific recombinase XerD